MTPCFRIKMTTVQKIILFDTKKKRKEKAKIEGGKKKKSKSTKLNLKK